MDQVVTVKRTREDLGDYDNPIILVVCRETRDNLMKFLKFISEQPTQNAQRVENEPIPSFLPKGSEQVRKRKTSAHRPEPENIDADDVKDLKEKYESFIKTFNELTQTYDEKDLKEDIPRSANLTEFRKIRKDITATHIHCSRTISYLDKLGAGDSRFVFDTKTNMKPNCAMMLPKQKSLIH